MRAQSANSASAFGDFVIGTYLLPGVVESALDVASTKRLIASHNKYAPTEAMLKAGNRMCQRPRAGTEVVAWTGSGGSVDES